MVSYVICFLDEDNRVTQFEYGNSNGDENAFIWDKYIGEEINSFIEIDLNRNNGFFNFNGTIFEYTAINNVMGKGLILYITKGVDKSKIFEMAFDCIQDAIHIYDQNGYLLFCNKSIETMEKSERSNIMGKHLLDIYDLNEDYSTILNTIKSRAPVLNRCDHFKAKDGEFITTINSAFPLFIENTLVGAVGFAQDASVFEQYRLSINIFEKYISERNLQNIRKEKSYYKYKYFMFDDLIGEDENFLDAINLARNISERDCSVLIYGETGTGKELFAQSIHSASHRKDKEFVAINCAAIPENLIEGILFGTEKGSFTGSSDKIGLFEQADGGTLFLDEINSMDIHMQSKLLRVLQEKKFKRVGGLKDIYCDVRVISSTNEEPICAIKDNKIRKDVYYRISTVTINIPALRERKKDIDILVQYFIEKLSRAYSKKTQGVSQEVINIFHEYEWQGNVRELVHVIEYCFNTMDGEVIQTKHLPKYLRRDDNGHDDKEKDPVQIKELRDIMNQYEKKVLEHVMKHNNNNITKSAAELGLSRQSLQYRLNKCNLLKTEADG